MALVTVQSVSLLEEAGTFDSPFRFMVVFHCVCKLEHDMDWRVVYVGSSDSPDFDQVLETVSVGPLLPGKHAFVVEAKCPDIKKVSRALCVVLCISADVALLSSRAHQSTDTSKRRIR